MNMFYKEYQHRAFINCKYIVTGNEQPDMSEAEEESFRTPLMGQKPHKPSAHVNEAEI